MNIIGITGGSGSGKTFFCHEIKKTDPGNIQIISLDSYYRDHSHLPIKERVKQNFDIPDAFDFKLLIEHLKSLKKGDPVHIPVYSFKTYSRIQSYTLINPSEIILTEGIMILNNPQLTKLLDLTIFLDIDKEIRLERIIQRDQQERGRSRERTIERFEKTVEPMYRKYIHPMMKKADYIFPSSQPDNYCKNLIFRKNITK